MRERAPKEARAARIRELKARNPHLTWRSIADEIGVAERSAVYWARTGGIAFEHAQQLADLLGADRDWLWRGDIAPTKPLTMDEKLDAILARLDSINEQLETLQAVRTALQLLEGAAGGRRPSVPKPHGSAANHG